jgi:arsenate reductase
MGEALLREDLGEKIEVYSAGTHPSFVHPLTIKVLNDLRINTSILRSKSYKEFLDKEIDLAITVCDYARERCPIFPNAQKMIHKGYPDPADMPDGDTNEEKMAFLRDKMRVDLKELVIKELNL